jgi:hypothetical protein
MEHWRDDPDRKNTAVLRAKQSATLSTINPTRSDFVLNRGPRDDRLAVRSTKFARLEKYTVVLFCTQYLVITASRGGGYEPAKWEINTARRDALT